MRTLLVRALIGLENLGRKAVRKTNETTTDTASAVLDPKLKPWYWTGE
jgi:hypothetical protein